MWLNHKILFVSSHLFLLPIMYYIVYAKKTRIQSMLFSALFSNFIFSIAFWYNPIKHSLIHRIDAIFARTSIILLLLYTLFIHNLSFYVLFWFILSVFTMFFFFYMSNRGSSQQWCGLSHIMCHLMSHIFACLCIFFMVL